MGLLLLWKGGASQVGVPSGIYATPGSMSGLQRTTLEKRLPSKVQAPGVGLSGQSGPKMPGVTTQAPTLITPEEPWA